MQVLVPKPEIELGYKYFLKKQLFKVKRDDNRTIAKFKTKQIVKDDFQWFGIDFKQTLTIIV